MGDEAFACNEQAEMGGWHFLFELRRQLKQSMQQKSKKKTKAKSLYIKMKQPVRRTK